MNSQSFIRETLQNHYNQKKSLHNTYSLRSFAKDINIAPAALSSFLNAKRNFSKKMAIKIFESLMFGPELFIQLEEAFSKDNRVNQKPQKKENTERMILQSQLYYLLVDPLYYSYLSLIETINFQDNDEENAQKLNTTNIKIKKIKERLIELNLIKMENNKLIPITSTLATSDNIPNNSLKARHTQNMEDAKKAIINSPIEERYFAFETLSFDDNDLKIVQTKINQLMDDLIWLSKKGSKKEHVYEFCAHYFPRTARLSPSNE